ncbi:Mitochondrial substrate carrier family protein P [Linum grandiflorum]
MSPKIGREITMVDLDGLIPGIDFLNPATVKFVMYPIAGVVVVSLGETLVAPLTRMTILSQLKRNHKRKLHQLGELVQAFFRTKFGYGFSYFGIISFVHSHLIRIVFVPYFPDNMPCGLVLTMSGGLSALTTSIILLPFEPSSNNKEGYIATFRNIWRDGGFRSLIAKIPKTDVALMTIAIGVYEIAVLVRSYKRPRVIVDLTFASIVTLASIAPEIMGRDFERFLRNFRNSKGLWKGNMVSVIQGLTYCGVYSFAYLNLRSLLTTSVPSLLPKSVALTSGAFASLASCLASHPLDTLITHITAEKDHNPDATWKTTIANLCRKDGGLRSQLYAGLSASLLSIVPYITISLVACEGVSILLERSSSTKETSFMFDLARTGIATFIASAAMFPFEVVRRRMQMEKGSANRLGLLETFRRIFREEGVGAFYSGIHSHFLKVLVGHTFAFTCFELVTEFSN